MNQAGDHKSLSGAYSEPLPGSGLQRSWRKRSLSSTHQPGDMDQNAGIKDVSPVASRKKNEWDKLFETEPPPQLF